MTAGRDALTAGRKIASAAVKNRTQSPFFVWLRDKLLAVHRQSVAPPPGFPTEDGKCHFNYPHRFPNTQTARSPDAPALPGGVHNLIADNYYQSRDGRRNVAPPPKLYQTDKEGQIGIFSDVDNKTIERPILAANKGPSQNFGLKTPTPGFGHEWTRNIQEEQVSQIHDTDLAEITKFDKYTKLY